MTLPDQILSNLTFALTEIHFSILQSRQRDKNANGRITQPVQYLKKKNHGLELHLRRCE